jgi:hypothetical protein
MKNINRIFLFGDSWIEGQGTYEFIGNDGRMYEPNIPFEKLNEWLKQNSWNKFIKKYTSSKIINLAKQGSDNYLQFSELNNQIVNLTDTDLVLFGLTSKLRDRKSIVYAFDMDYDSKLIHSKNPLRGIYSWEKLSNKLFNFGFNKDNNQIDFKDTNEKKFTQNFIQDYFSMIYDDVPFEYISQVNYLFYQQYCKLKNINIIFFDLFEPYVNPNFVKETYNIDKDVYINYADKTMNQFLIEYEIKHIKDNELSIWENGKRRPDLKGEIFHPNQHGYELYVDYLFNNILPKKYQFIN